MVALEDDEDLAEKIQRLNNQHGQILVVFFDTDQTVRYFPANELVSYQEDFIKTIRILGTLRRKPATEPQRACKREFCIQASQGILGWMFGRRLKWFPLNVPNL